MSICSPARTAVVDLRVAQAFAAVGGTLANRVVRTAHRGIAAWDLPRPLAFALCGTAENAVNGALGGAVNAALLTDVCLQPGRWLVGFMPLPPAPGARAPAPNREAGLLGWLLHLAATPLELAAARAAAAAGRRGAGGARLGAALLGGLAAALHLGVDACLLPAQVALCLPVLVAVFLGCYVGAIRGTLAGLPAGGAAVRRAVEPVGSPITLPFGAASIPALAP